MAKMFFSLALAFVVGVYVGAWLACVGRNRVWQDSSVKAGHAEYYLDKDRVRQWRWLPTESEADDE